MGKLLQGILGGISGSVGNVVGSSWKGIPVIKSKPLSVANPRTAGQVLQRGKMTNIVEFAGQMLSSLIKPLWDRFAQQMSGYNSFVSTNIDLFENEMPSPAASLQISKGKMASTSASLASLSPGTSLISVTWTNDAGSGLKLAADLAYVLVVNETKGELGISAAEQPRSNEATSVSLPSFIASDDVINAYLAFRRADGTVVSDTSFDTTTV